MDESQIQSDFKREVKDALSRLRDHSLLYDVMAITLLFLVYKLAANLVLTFIDTRGFRALHSLGTSFEKPLFVADIPFYESLAAQSSSALPSSPLKSADVSLSNIAGALDKTRPDIVPDALQSLFQNSPIVAAVTSVLMLCACALPLVYFVLNIANDKPRPIIRRVFQSLVILGGAAWAAAVFANGHWIRTPIDLVRSAGFWLIQGALCLHLFTDLGSKARRFAPPVAMIVILLIIGTMNSVATGRLFGFETGPYQLETEQLHNAITSGWWASLHDSASHFSGYTAALIIILFLAGDNLLDFMFKHHPLLRTLIGWISLSVVLVIGCAFLGVMINTPSQTLIWQAAFFVVGMGCLSGMAKKTKQAAQAKAIIDHFINRLDRAPKPADLES